jgi:hypothetical protein
MGVLPELGPIGYAPEAASHDNPFGGRPYAGQTQRNIDREVARLLREARRRRWACCGTTAMHSTV